MTETELLASVPDQLFIGGEWRASTSGKSLDVNDPSTGKTIKQIADATPDDAKAAMDAAANAQDSWAAPPARQRGDRLRRAFDLMIERRDECSLLMTLEMGKPLAEAQGEVTYGAEFLRWFS